MAIRDGYLLRMGRFKTNYPTLKRILIDNKISYFLYHHRGRQNIQQKENAFPESNKEYGQDSISKLCYFTTGSIRVEQDDQEYIKIATFFYNRDIESHETIYTFRNNLDKLKNVLEKDL